MRHGGYADFLDVRRPAPASCFVAVHDPFEDDPSVEEIDGISWGLDRTYYVGLRVGLRNGFTDIVLSSPEDPPFNTHTIGSDVTGCGDIVFAGRFAHIRLYDGQVVHAYGVDATHLEVGDVCLKGPGHYTGTITRIHRIEAGAEHDIFETNTPPPKDLTLDSLEGRCPLAQQGRVAG
jgi:hypothetical protein